MPPNPLANAWLYGTRHKQLCAMQLAQAPKSSPPPCQIIHTRAHGLPLRNLFEEIYICAGRQFIVCSTLYGYALQKFLGGKND